MAERNSLKKVIELTEEEYQTLESTGTLTVDDITLTYDQFGTIYLTPDIEGASYNNRLAEVESDLNAIQDSVSALESDSVKQVKSNDSDESLYLYGRQLGQEGIFVAHADKTAAYSIVIRDAYGRIHVADPVANDQAASKFYVDNKTSFQNIEATDYLMQAGTEDGSYKTIHYDVASNCIELGTCTKDEQGNIVYSESNPIATRDDDSNYIHNNLIQWDETSKRFTDSGVYLKGGHDSQGNLVECAIDGGYRCEAQGKASLALGYETVASAQCSTAIGYRTKANGYDSFTSGLYAKAQSDDSAAFGVNTIATRSGQLVAGEANEADSNAMFIIGNGTADPNDENIVTRSTAFKVNKNGTATIQTAPINDMDIVNKNYCDFRVHTLNITADGLNYSIKLVNKSDEEITADTLANNLLNAFQLSGLTYEEGTNIYRIFNVCYAGGNLNFIVMNMDGTDNILQGKYVGPGETLTITDTVTRY